VLVVRMRLLLVLLLGVPRSSPVTSPSSAVRRSLFA